MSDEIFLVGGALRDELLGLTPHDRDYVVIVPNLESLCIRLQYLGYKPIHTDYKHLIVRARDSTGCVCDFALARQESNYSDHRHPNKVVACSNILQDLARRDFTINAMARAVGKNSILDPFGGHEDIQRRILRCVGNPKLRMHEDALRLVRALRFIVTRGFTPDPALRACLSDSESIALLHTIPTERIRSEVAQCLAHDVYRTFTTLVELCD